MGRLGYEMWRATRLVVDTGIHAKGWTKEQAVAFMKDNTTLTDANIDAEVNRYISNPGQALAYKLGELKIRELRARAEKALGDKFDLRRFHDAVLGQGAVPLDALEAQINAWIAAEKAQELDRLSRRSLVAAARVPPEASSSALLERLVDQLLGAAGEAGRADRRAAVDAGPAIGFERDAPCSPRPGATGASRPGDSFSGMRKRSLSGLRAQTTTSSSVERGQGSVP